MFTTAHLFALLATYGYAILFPLSVVEGPVVAMIAGFFVSTGALNGVLVFCLLMAGDMVGDTLYYGLGKMFRRKKIPRILQAIGITEPRVQRFDLLFEKHDWKILLLGKTQAVGGVILFSAGFARMPYLPFLAYNFIGSLPKVLLFLVIGYYFGNALKDLDHVVSDVALISFGLAVLLLISYVILKAAIRVHFKELRNE